MPPLAQPLLALGTLALHRNTRVLMVLMSDINLLLKAFSLIEMECNYWGYIFATSSPVNHFLSLTSKADPPKPWQEQLPLIVGSATATLVFIIAVVVIAIVCLRSEYSSFNKLWKSKAWKDKSLLGKIGKRQWRRTRLHRQINSGQPAEYVQTVWTYRTFVHSFLSTSETIEIASNVNFVCMSSKPPQNTLSGLPCHLWGYWMPD